MVTKTGQATVDIETRLVPIAYDGDNASVPVPAATVESALANFDFKPGYVGFKFAEAVKAKIAVDETGEEITLSRESSKGKNFIFANKVLTAEEFNTAAEYKTREADWLRQSWADKLANPDTVIFASDRGVRILDDYEKKNTVLINRKGEQLFPLKKA